MYGAGGGQSKRFWLVGRTLKGLRDQAEVTAEGAYFSASRVEGERAESTYYCLVGRRLREPPAGSADEEVAPQRCDDCSNIHWASAAKNNHDRHIVFFPIYLCLSHKIINT